MPGSVVRRRRLLGAVAFAPMPDPTPGGSPRLSVERLRAARASFGSVAVEVQRLPPGTYRPGSLVEPARDRQLELLAVRTGRMRISHGDNVVGLSQGEGAFIAPWTNSLLVDATTELLRVTAPAELAQGSPMVDSAAVHFVPSTSILLQPMTAFVSQLFDTRNRDASGFGRYYVERLLQEMLQGLLVDVNRAVPAPRMRDAFAFAISVITAQCTDPGLSAAAVASEVSLSLRQLERVFRANGTTIAAEIRHARTEQAIALLKDRAHDALSVEQIGRFVGFSNGSSLARALASDGQPSPSSIRRAPR